MRTLPGVKLALAELLATPAQMEGPFYPLTLPLDRDNDLVTVAGRSGRAKGTILDVAGRILDTGGKPVAGVKIEIWQVNGFGRYHHPHDDSDLPMDPNFQGYGETVSDAEGGYRFRTVKPVAYPGRAPHIHFALTGPGFGPFYTQMYLAGAPENARDFLLRNVTDRKARESADRAARALPGSRAASSRADSTSCSAAHCYRGRSHERRRVAEGGDAAPPARNSRASTATWTTSSRA